MDMALWGNSWSVSLCREWNSNHYAELLCIHPDRPWNEVFLGRWEPCKTVVPSHNRCVKGVLETVGGLFADPQWDWVRPQHIEKYMYGVLCNNWPKCPTKPIVHMNSEN
jgi:hypothetical protein